jgi:uncharacterized membrane protein
MDMQEHEWLLKRNCSLSPRQLVIADVALCFGLLAMAFPFAIGGAWHVLFFAMIEIAGVAVAFFHYARHATDHEHIILTDGCLLVERIEAGRVHQTRLDPCRTHIKSPARFQDLIDLEARGTQIKVGRFITAARRRQVAQELRQELERECGRLSRFS